MQKKFSFTVGRNVISFSLYEVQYEAFTKKFKYSRETIEQL